MMELAAKPAGGAALDQVAIATGSALAITALLLWLISGHRAGRTTHLSRAAAAVSRMSGLPGWAALPNLIAAASLTTALLGMYWDIGLHVGVGRDDGPLANPAHYLILVGLYGVFSAGILAVSIPRAGERPGPAALRLGRDWHAPVGGVLMAVCGGFALVGFPLDDVWHRLFGQDVTLWSPTHLMLIGGAGMTLVGQAVLLVEGTRARRLAADGARAQPDGDGARPDHRGATSDEQMPTRVAALRRMGLVGGFLVGLSTFQAEFDFGVPQYAQVFQPFLIALAAGVALVCARLWIGRGGALLAAAMFLIVRGIVDVVTGPLVFDEPFPALPLYLAEAAVVELAALVLIGRPLALGIAGGVLIGTVGFAAEYGWTNAVFRLPWQPDLLPEGVLFASAGGVAGGILGALFALGLRGSLPRPAVARGGVAFAGATIAVCVALGLAGTEVPENVRAQVELTRVTGGAESRAAHATVRIVPASSVEETKWLTVTSWQGGGLHVDRLERVAPGVFRTTEPMPLHGEWKTLVRLHEGRNLTALPVYMPADPAIPAPAVPATERFERPFTAEIDMLQRERKDDVPAWLWVAASAVVLALYAGFFAALAWGVGRLSRRWDDLPAPPAGPSEGADPVRTGRRAVARPAPAG